MKNLSRQVLIATVLAFIAFDASATTITFDDTSHVISNGYSDLNWSNFAVLNASGSNYVNMGYANSIVSNSNVAYNSYGYDASFSSGTAFTLNSGYFTAAWSDGLSLQVKGFLNNIEIYSSLLTLSTSGPVLKLFNWDNVDKVSFHSYGGVDNPNDIGSGSHFALDNLTINDHPSASSTVPLPAALPLMLSGLVVLGFVLRRRKSVAV